MTQNDWLVPIIDIIKQLREDHHYSLQQVSERSGITKSHLSNIENGKSIPSIDTLIAIAKCYNITFQIGFISGFGPSDYGKAYAQGRKDTLDTLDKMLGEMVNKAIKEDDDG